MMNDSKEHILLVSLTLFLQKSFKEVTMKEIVDKTGMSKGAFYHYFSSKEQVFAEVINHFFLRMITNDYSKYSDISLKRFSMDVLVQAEKSATALAMMVADTTKDANLQNNVYYLIFDALKMLPEFKKHHQEQQLEELKAWTHIVATARKNREIQSLIVNGQIAKLFIYLQDGVNINLIYGTAKSELEDAWDALYQTLKV